MDLQQEIVLKVHAPKKGTGVQERLSLKERLNFSASEARKNFDSTDSAVQREENRSASPYSLKSIKFGGESKAGFDWGVIGEQIWGSDPGSDWG